ncbi:M4 family metallopeptidase [Actinoplanes sp. CA-252034]|uniref:M4 family metallopeptidase n=1 Tax=Actinoplanes sp. CA-252034 TaxID=3239906 RepID=UPI003D99EE97
MAVRHSRALIALTTALALTGGGCTVTEDETTAEPAGRLAAATGEPAPAPAPSTTASATASAPEPRVTRKAAIDAARAGIRRNATEIRSAPDEKYQAVDTVVDDGGAQHVRFHRTHDGLPVLGGDFVVHSAADGSFRSATVAQDRVIDVPETTKVSRAEAIAAAGLDGRVEARKVVDAVDGEPALAWEVTGPAKVVVVDAVTGRIRRSYDTVESAEKGTGHGLQVGDVELDTTRRADGSYTLVDPERGDTTVRDALNHYDHTIKSADFTDADNVWGDGARGDRATAAVDVHYGLAKTWDYLRDTFGRLGAANDGKGLTAYVHYDVDENNAGYSRSCRCAFFGDGSAGRAPYTPLDIVGHEMAHGLNASTAALINAGESGGLNEASSDIFGTLVEFYANNPADPPDYIHGEKTRLDGTPGRWMDEPSKDGKSVSCWTPAIKDLDEHYSSGIGTKFFYNLAVGSAASQWGESTPCGGAAPVTGIGQDKAAQIWYRALTLYMVSNTNFAGARGATLTAAADLYGADSVERRAVDAAWLAVGVDSSQVPTNAPELGPLPYFVYVQKVGDPVRVQASARDPQRQPLTFSATGLPPGVSIDADGLISGAPTSRAKYDTTVTVTDPDGNTDTGTMSWAVKGPVLLQSADPGISTRLGPVTRVSFGATFVDAPDYWQDRSDSFKVTATGLPVDLKLSVTDSRGVYQAVVSGYPTIASVGTGTAVLTGTDADGNQVTASIPWEILPPYRTMEPRDVSVTGGEGSAVVRWTRPPFDLSYFSPTAYVVRVSPGTETRVPTRDPALTLTGLDPRRAYTIGVRSVSEAGESAEQLVTLAPTGVTVSVSPTAIAYGKTTVLSGRVLHNGTSPRGALTVTIEQRPAGRTVWSRVGTARTDAKGVWRSTVKPAVTTAYRVRFTGATGMWAATSGNTYTWVRYAVTAKASTTKPKANKKIKISGTAKPARAGATVTLQYRKGSRWITITSVKTSKTGAYAFSRAFKRGTWTLRVVVARDGYNTTGTSGTVKLTAR